jgi:YebC/PmpR family DNA-binding regulatory protein
MSGHSKWSTIKRQKALTDAKRGAVFTRLGNQIAIAARSGTDPALNSTLAMVIEKAKAANMPMSNIDRAIQRVSDKNAAQLTEAMYEGYGPGGVGILVQVATDNINRTYPEVRLAFTKHGGSMAEKGAVAFQFDHKGIIRVKGIGEDQLLTILDCGAEDAVEEGDETIVYTDSKALAAVRDALKAASLTVIDAELAYVPKNMIMISDKETAGKIERLMDALDDLDDVTANYSNFEIAESLLT